MYGCLLILMGCSKQVKNEKIVVPVHTANNFSRPSFQCLWTIQFQKTFRNNGTGKANQQQYLQNNNFEQ